MARRPVVSNLLRRKPGGLTDLVFLGAGGTARDVLSLVDDLNRNQERYRCVALLDDDKTLWGREVQGVPITGPLADAKHFDSAQFVNTLGSPRNYRCRHEVPARLGLSAKRFETLIHPTAALSSSATIGEGTIILPHVVLLSGVTVSDQVLILAGSILNHDVRIGDYAILASAVNLSGAVEIGSCSYIGSGACLIQGIRVGENALVGMGSVVLENVTPSSVVAGNPARLLSKTKLSSS
jgi:sugar O-acyltransferase (sialic acid O-acetyltransferase NeuD family)